MGGTITDTTVIGLRKCAGIPVDSASSRFDHVKDETSQTLFYGERGLPNGLGWG